MSKFGGVPVQKAGSRFGGVPVSTSAAPGIARQPRRNDTIDSAVAGASQGYTFGFGDEIMGALSGAGRYGISRLVSAPGSSDKSFADIYREERDKNRKQLSEAATDNPGTFTAGYVGGAVASPAKFKGGIVTQAAKGGAAFGLGESEADSFGGMALDAAKGGATGAATGAVLRQVARAANAGIKGAQNVTKGFSAKSAEALDDVAARMRAESTANYAAMRGAGATINPQATQKIVGDIEAAVRSDGILNPALHDKALAVLAQMKEAAKGKGFELEELDQWRQLLGQVAGNFTDKINARKAKIAISAIDDAVETLGASSLSTGSTQAVQSLQQARAGWARMSRFETVADIVRKADGDANYLKRELAKLLNNPKKTRGFSPQEREALKDASLLTGGEGVLKMLGKFGFDLGNSRIGTGVGAGVGAVGGGVGAGLGGAVAVPVVGTVARYGQKALARGKAERLLDAIEPGAYKSPKGIEASPAVVGAISRSAATTGAIPASDAPARSEATPPPAPITPSAPLPPQSSAAPFIQRMAMAESSGNTNAKASAAGSTSTASGLMQFTDDTWARSVAKWGKELGVTLKDKGNPQAQIAMAEKLAADNARILTRQLGREVTDGEVYAAHFLGARGAAKLITAAQASPDRQAVTLFPRAWVNDPVNRTIFFDKRRPRTVQEVMNILNDKVA